MTGHGTVEGIFIAPEAEAEMQELDGVEAVAGKGLRGDRYFRESQQPHPTSLSLATSLVEGGACP